MPAECLRPDAQGAALGVRMRRQAKLLAEHGFDGRSEDGLPTFAAEASANQDKEAAIGGVSTLADVLERGGHRKPCDLQGHVVQLEDTGADPHRHDAGLESSPEDFRRFLVAAGAREHQHEGGEGREAGRHPRAQHAIEKLQGLVEAASACARRDCRVVRDFVRPGSELALRRGEERERGPPLCPSLASADGSVATRHLHPQAGGPERRRLQVKQQQRSLPALSP
mmetsp:Transcript_63536/g.169711  ORF Transcript_63536/g.169711 Transcript_63536/m.169711 type:complete len:225 (+) Transcript_63536:128-802(+)